MPAAARTRAVRDGDDYVHHRLEAVHQPGLGRRPRHGLRGHRSRARPRHRRLSCFVVEVPTDGLQRRPGSSTRWASAAARPPSSRSTASASRPRTGSARRATGSTSRCGRSSGAGRGSRPRPSGIAQGALEAATAYAKERKQFGQRIGDFQMVGAMLADMDAGTEAARQLLYKACVEIEAGAPDAGRWSAMCKLVAGDTAMRVTTDAVQVLGGYGYIDEFPVERMMRDAKITQLYEGTQQIQRLVLARSLLGKGS